MSILVPLAWSGFGALCFGVFFLSRRRPFDALCAFSVAFVLFFSGVVLSALQ